MNNWIEIKIKKRINDNTLTLEEGMAYALKFGLLGVITKDEETSLMSMLEGMLQEE
ncbi:hypothetical protein SH1V18_03250 [Vallitalea longa]|uniref:Uncharacterized protein n=1 Tax=Vallitalea longa TaxID=2936439 RepID=A0A9W5Y8E2_9FIRM|nr:hypothetical protein [Vallitalea longa]GKX27845.1 hypothetical protein SH1V18_03250 [Vallitalea longa]